MNQIIKPKPLSIKTIIGLIAASSSCTMSFYLTYQILKFYQSPSDYKTIFLPLYINFNYFKLFQKKYDISNLKYLDHAIDLNQIKRRINFKIKNCIVNFKLLNLKDFKIIENNVDFKFIINNPTISGLTIDLKNHCHDEDNKQHVDDKQENLVLGKDKKIDINYNWSIKLFNSNIFTFLLNQPTIKFKNELDFTFNGEFGIYDLNNIGKVKFDGVIEDNDIKFNNIVVEIEGDRNYKVM